MTLVVITLVVGVFIGRLVDIQVVRAADLNQEAAGNQTKTIEVDGTRGAIVDSNGVLLADSVMRYNMTMSPKNVKPFPRETDDGEKIVSVEQAAGEIGAITGQTVEQILAIVSDSLAADPESDYATVVKAVDLDTYQKLDELDIPWTYFETNPGRIYPSGAVAGNLVGYVGAEDEAQEGVEYAQNSCLAATDGSETYERGADGVRIPGSTISSTPAVDGSEVVLTIDSDLQYYAQQVLAQQVQAVGGSSGMAVVQEVKTGKLLAVADYPTVDPNDVGATEADYRGSRAFTSPFEPGSTFKAITAAALIDQNAATPTTQVVAPYRYIAPNGADINDSDYHGDENLTLTGVLKESSNTGISKLGEKLSDETRYDYLKKFGIGTETAVGFPGEDSGILHDYEDWDNQTEYATMFGQGLSATAVQIASVYQTLGNAGVRLPVQLVEGCRNADGTVTEAPAGTGVQAVSEAAADTTVQMLQSVVNEGWLSDVLTIPGYNVAAKTGTAQQADGSGAYGDSSTYIVSLAGVAPAEDPQYVVSVNIFDPDTMRSSGAAAPVFQQIMTQVLKANRVQPSATPAVDYPSEW